MYIFSRKVVFFWEKKSQQNIFQGRVFLSFDDECFPHTMSENPKWLQMRSGCMCVRECKPFMTVQNGIYLKISKLVHFECEMNSLDAET